MPIFGPPNANKLQAKGDVPGLIKALGFKKDPAVRRDAAAALGQLGDSRAVEPLLAALSDVEPEVRASVAAALGLLGELSAVEPLIGALQDDDPSVRTAAALALGGLGPALAGIGDDRAVLPLILALQDGFAAVREGASVGLGRMGSPAVAPLLAALRGQDLAVRKGATEALVRIGFPAIEPLVAALDDPVLRPMASMMLGRIGDARAVDPLIATLRAESEPVRRAAAETLDLLSWTPDAGAAGAAYWAAKGQWHKCVEIGRPAVDTLVDALKHSDSLVRQLATKGLGQIRDVRAVDPLIVALKGREDGRAAAAEALGAIDDDRAVEPLIGALKDTGPVVRAAAARSLGLLGDVRAVDKLITALRDHEPVVRAAAAGALGEIGDIRAVDPLIAALRGREDVRGPAASALGRIGDARAVEPLIGALNDMRVCVAAAEALVRIGAPAAAPLVATLRDRAEVVRNAAAEALIVQIGAPAFGPLMAALRDEQEAVRQSAADMLDRLTWAPDSAEAAATYWAGRNQWARCVQLGAPAVGALAVATRTWQGTESRCGATEALGQIGDARAIDALAAAMKDRAADVRKCAVAGLGRTVDARAVEPLIAATKDRVEEVRRAAEDALARFTDPRAVAALEAIRPKVIVTEPVPEVAASPVEAPVAVGTTADSQPAAVSASGVAAAVPSVAPVSAPTLLVPQTGLLYWAVPDGRTPPAGRLDAFLELVVESTVGDWAQVRAVNGWRGWVDGRMLMARRG
jgi:HEAT repeat protein